MIGVALSRGSPCSPWHALQIWAATSMSSAAIAGMAATAKTAAVPRMTEKRLLNTSYVSFVSPRTRRKRPLPKAVRRAVIDNAEKIIAKWSVALDRNQRARLLVRGFDGHFLPGVV